MIPLIDKLDGFETIGLKIAEILALEQTYQQALAVEASKDPALWAFKVFHERSNPWESYLYDDADTTPIVNIWYNNSSIDEKNHQMTALRPVIQAVSTLIVMCQLYMKRQNQGICLGMN